MNIYEQAERELTEQRRKQRVQACKDLMTQIDKLEGENETAKANILQNEGPRRGVCRICGCTERRACTFIVGEGLSAREVQCWWADKTKTLCTAPSCRRKAAAETRAR